MNNAHIESKAVAGGRKGVQSLVRRFAACCLIGVAAMSAAQAGPRDRDRDAQAQRDSYRSERNQRQPEQRQPDERQQRQYDTRAEDQRRNQQEQQNAQNNDRFQRSGRLTPDERRDLRRQINEAGADIYPARRRR